MGVAPEWAPRVWGRDRPRPDKESGLEGGTAPAQRKQWLSVWVSLGTQGALVPRRPLGGLPAAPPSAAPNTGRDLSPGRACLPRSRHLTHTSDTHGRPLGPRPTRDSQTGQRKRGEGRHINSSSGAEAMLGGLGATTRATGSRNQQGRGLAGGGRPPRSSCGCSGNDPRRSWAGAQEDPGSRRQSGSLA